MNFHHQQDPDVPGTGVNPQIQGFLVLPAGPVQNEFRILQLGFLTFSFLKTHSRGTANGAEQILKTQQSHGTTEWKWRTPDRRELGG